MPGKSVARYKPGDLVFAKMRGFPHWPARICKGEDVVKKKIPVFFFGTHQIGVVPVANIVSFSGNKAKYGTGVRIRGFSEGMWEIENKPGVGSKHKVLAGNKKDADQTPKVDTPQTPSPAKRGRPLGAKKKAELAAAAAAAAAAEKKEEEEEEEGVADQAAPEEIPSKPQTTPRKKGAPVKPAQAKEELKRKHPPTPSVSSPANKRRRQRRFPPLTPAQENEAPKPLEKEGVDEETEKEKEPEEKISAEVKKLGEKEKEPEKKIPAAVKKEKDPEKKTPVPLKKRGGKEKEPDKKKDGEMNKDGEALTPSVKVDKRKKRKNEEDEEKKDEVVVDGEKVPVEKEGKPEASGKKEKKGEGDEENNRSKERKEKKGEAGAESREGSKAGGSKALNEEKQCRLAAKRESVLRSLQGLLTSGRKRESSRGTKTLKRRDGGRIKKEVKKEVTSARKKTPGRKVISTKTREGKRKGQKETTESRKRRGEETMEDQRTGRVRMGNKKTMEDQRTGRVRMGNKKTLEDQRTGSKKAVGRKKNKKKKEEEEEVDESKSEGKQRMAGKTMEEKKDETKTQEKDVPEQKIEGEKKTTGMKVEEEEKKTTGMKVEEEKKTTGMKVGEEEKKKDAGILGKIVPKKSMGQATAKKEEKKGEKNSEGGKVVEERKVMELKKDGKVVGMIVPKSLEQKKNPDARKRPAGGEGGKEKCDAHLQPVVKLHKESPSGTVCVKSPEVMTMVDSTLHRLHGDLRISLKTDNPDISKCLLALDQLSMIYVTSQNIQRHSQLVATLRKMRRYRGSRAVMDKASMLYSRFKNAFLLGEGEEVVSASFLRSLLEEKEQEEARRVEQWKEKEEEEEGGERRVGEQEEEKREMQGGEEEKLNEGEKEGRMLKDETPQRADVACS